MHPAGFEPASTRLRDGGSAVELRVRLPGQGHPHLGKPWPRRFSRSAKSIASLAYTIILHRIALGRIRTFNLRFRRPELSPVELPVRLENHAPWRFRSSDLPVISRVLCL